MNLAVWILMSLAQLPLLGVVLQGVQGLSGLVMLLLLPVPALVISLFGYRPGRAVPDDRVIRDWGTAFGWAFVQAGHRTYWVTRGSLTGLEDAPRPLAPLDLKPQLDGFQLSIPPQASGRPDMLIAAVRSASATAVLWALGMLWTLLTPAPTTFADVGAWIVLSLLSVVGVLVLQLPALFPLMLAYETYQRSASQMTLRGRTLTVDGETFLLGQPDERIEHGPPGTLTLSNGSQRLVVRGQAAALEQLVPVLRGVTADADGSGEASEIPQALTALKATQKLGQ